MMRSLAIAAVLMSAAACSPPAATTEETTPVPIEGVPQAAEAPAEVLAVIHADDAAFAPSESIQDNTTGAMTYEVKGTGRQITTYSVMHFNEGWRVVEVRRELAWADAPRAVRDVVATSSQAMVPDKVEEVYQPGAEGVTYDLYHGDEIVLAVRDLGDGQAAIMPAPH